jgi:hypothetical protein
VPWLLTLTSGGFCPSRPASTRAPETECRPNRADSGRLQAGTALEFRALEGRRSENR